MAGRYQRRFENLRHHMAGADEIDVVAALGLQIQHHVCQFLGSHFAPGPLLADVPVLAELTA